MEGSLVLALLRLLVSLLANSLVMTMVYNGSSGSLPLMFLFHWLTNLRYPWEAFESGLITQDILSGIVALGLLAYLFYQYLMYALAWAFGPLFPIFVAIYALCLVSLAWIASTVKLAKLPGEFTERFPRRGVAAFSIIMGILLIGMWLGRIIPAMRGEIQGVLLGQTTLVVQALDLGIIVPLALFTGLAVLRRQPLGYLLSSVFVVKGAAMAAAITAMLLSAWAVEGSPEVPPLVLFGAATAMAGWLGFRMYRSSRPV
jgi:hypothetical protein